jgi:2'-5' RNA ligase
VLADIEAFDVTLDGALGHFQQRKQVTAHLVPDEPAALSHVVNVAAASLGLSAAERPFRPHLTVGQFKNAAAYASIQPLPAVTFRCTEIAVLTRVNDEPFKLLRALKLGAGQLRD